MRKIKIIFTVSLLLFICTSFVNSMEENPLNLTDCKGKAIRRSGEKQNPSLEASSLGGESSVSLTSGSSTIKLINNEEGLKHLQNLCKAHQEHHKTMDSRDYSGLDFNRIKKQINFIERIKKEMDYGRIFGVYGFYSTVPSEETELVGIIQMLGITTPSILGYAECQMTMHPKYRGQGLGTSFRRKFQDETITPNIGSKVKFQNKDNSLEIELQDLTFHGTLGYIHAYNLASRKLVTRLNHFPVQLAYNNYFNSGGALQIIYINPPLPESERLQAPLPQEIITTILENDLDKNPEIFINYVGNEPRLLISFNKLLEGLETPEDPIPKGISPEELFEMVFLDITQKLIATPPSEYLQQDAVFLLAREIKMLVTIQELMQSNKQYFPPDGAYNKWFENQRLEEKQKELRKMLGS